MKLSPHFTLAEMTASATAARIGDSNQPQLAAHVDALRLVCLKVLEPVRAHFGRPVRVNSGYRSAKTNAAVGSSSTSQHRRGEAADIEIDGVSNADLAAWIATHIEFDQLILEAHRAGDPNSGWVHVSYAAGRNRRQVLTMTIGTHGPVYAAGLPD
ncbi:D-Ala-D-Ala carboxypeptidase family metallohydrolase [Sphingomonas phyllosphaerae]|uniref:D-Ala-D-Ala carboxypeptidase family metallohydrolase n=1 Tax=Sphingomonas phyllosphaerae TaxID=257003 RepID=UPI00040DA63F|nr:D-Ala-D-Ala carboxypeptidase family metallohydrolase [Sphingomonas phyllosphaerae]